MDHWCLLARQWPLSVVQSRQVSRLSLSWSWLRCLRSGRGQNVLSYLLRLRRLACSHRRVVFLAGLACSISRPRTSLSALFLHLWSHSFTGRFVVWTTSLHCSLCVTLVLSCIVFVTLLPSGVVGATQACSLCIPSHDVTWTLVEPASGAVFAQTKDALY